MGCHIIKVKVYLLTYLLTHSFTHSLIYSINYSLTHLITYSLTHSLTHSITYLLTSWSKVLLEKLTGFHLLKKFPAFYGTRRFITAFTSARRLSLPEPARSSPYLHIPFPEDPS